MSTTSTQLRDLYRTFLAMELHGGSFCAAPRFAVKLEHHPSYVTFLSPEDVGTWLQGFIAALPPLPED